jgi:hypothetical protein
MTTSLVSSALSALFAALSIGVGVQPAGVAQGTSISVLGWSPDDRFLAYTETTQVPGRMSKPQLFFKDMHTERVCSAGLDLHLEGTRVTWPGRDLAIVESGDRRWEGRPCGGWVRRDIAAQTSERNAAPSPDGRLRATVRALSTRNGIARMQTSFIDTRSGRVRNTHMWSVGPGLGQLPPHQTGEWLDAQRYLIHQTNADGPVVLDASGAAFAFFDAISQTQRVNLAGYRAGVVEVYSNTLLVAVNAPNAQNGTPITRATVPSMTTLANMPVVIVAGDALVNPSTPAWSTRVFVNEIISTTAGGFPTYCVNALNVQAWHAEPARIGCDITSFDLWRDNTLAVVRPDEIQIGPMPLAGSTFTPQHSWAAPSDGIAFLSAHSSHDGQTLAAVGRDASREQSFVYILRR